MKSVKIESNLNYTATQNGLPFKIKSKPQWIAIRKRKKVLSNLGIKLGISNQGDEPLIKKSVQILPLCR